MNDENIQNLCQWHFGNECRAHAPQLFLIGMTQDMAGQPKPVFMSRFPPCTFVCSEWQAKGPIPVWES